MQAVVTPEAQHPNSNERNYATLRTCLNDMLKVAHLYISGLLCSDMTGMKSRIPCFWYIFMCFSMRDGSGKKNAVTSVLNLFVTSATAACIPALRHKNFLTILCAQTARSRAPRVMFTTLAIYFHDSTRHTDSAHAKTSHSTNYMSAKLSAISTVTKLDRGSDTLPLHQHCRTTLGIHQFSSAVINSSRTFSTGEQKHTLPQTCSQASVMRSIGPSTVQQ